MAASSSAANETLGLRDREEEKAEKETLLPQQPVALKMVEAGQRGSRPPPGAQGHANVSSCQSRLGLYIYIFHSAQPLRAEEEEEKKEEETSGCWENTLVHFYCS